MEFKEFLVERRKRTGIPIRAFAAQVGISPSYLCDLESGHRSFPSDPTVAQGLFAAMVRALGLSDEEAMEFKMLADQSTLENGKLSADLRTYLLDNPQAQIALRMAKEKGVPDDMWAELLKKIEEAD